jgi:hypothetical protein
MKRVNLKSAFAFAVEVAAAQLGCSLAPSLHLIPGMPLGNNYTTVTTIRNNKSIPGDESSLVYKEK